MIRRRNLFRAGAVLLYVLLAGVTLQSIATALERREFHRPGPMVNVGDHQLHIHCVGAGAPTVVLEAPAAGMSAAWGWVQPAVARSARVCSYDRAGLGWSERAEAAYNPADTTVELQALLDGSGEQGPFILVGQGLGAAHATLFASRFESRTAALVLIDAPRPAASPAGKGGGESGGESGGENTVMRFAGSWPWLSRIGVLRIAGVLSRTAAGLPDPEGGALAAFLNRPDHLTQAARELARADEVIGLAATATLPGVPVTRLDVAGPARVAFLTDHAAAERVAAAILDVVGVVRKRTAPASSRP
jgi:pimeloyl-ACP methyl ester carboxylesterase